MRDFVERSGDVFLWEMFCCFGTWRSVRTELVKHKPAIEREDLRRLKESDVISLTTRQGLLLVSCHPVFLSTWTGRAEKLDEVQFPIPSGWKQKMVRNHGPWRVEQNTPRGKDDTATNYEKLGRMYQIDYRNDGVNALWLYRINFNPECNAFFQFPRRLW